MRIFLNIKIVDMCNNSSDSKKHKKNQNWIKLDVS